MDSLIKGMVGPQNYPPAGSYAFIRSGRQGDILTSLLHGRHYEQALQGNIFTMDSDSVTIAAANATKGALATAKFVNGFFNPLTSGKNAVLLFARVATVSGTPGGPFFYNYLDDSTINSAATGTVRATLLGSSYASVLRAQTGVVLANAAAATTALKQLGVMGGPAAIAAGAGMYDVVDDIAGRIIVPPGVLFGITALAAGTTHIVQSTLVWEEVPV
jgi:hypothetical protein